jgi:hypothetical protein
VTIEIPLNGGHVALVDDEMARFFAGVTWRAEARGPILYAVRTVPVGSPVSRYMHKRLTGWARTDHINGNGLDNRRANLRPADHSRNAQNGRAHRDGQSGFKGVSFDRRHGRWFGQIRANGEHFHLGTFGDPADAAKAYDAAAREAFGEFAALNFPLPGERSAINQVAS